MQHKVSVSSKGEYAEKLIDGVRELSDLIVLDVMLGDKDGRVICKKLKASDKTKHIPIIVISAHSSNKKSSLDVNATSFLAKPFESKTFLRAIENYL